MSRPWAPSRKVRTGTLRVQGDPKWEEALMRFLAPPRIFDAYLRYKRPWWARAIAYGIAARMVVQELRGAR